MTRPAVVYELMIRLSSPALLGGRAGAGARAQTWLTAGEDGQVAALLPGSALRGVLRHASRRFAAARGVRCARGTDGGGECSCVTCELFGGSGRRGRLHVRSATATATALTDVTRVAIDRTRGTAAPDALWSARLVQAEFQVRLELDQPDRSGGGNGGGDDPDVAGKHLQALLGWLNATGIALGRSKSTAGRATLAARQRPVSAQVASELRPGASSWWRLRLRAVEPVRLGGLRHRPYFQHGLGAIPASTLVGALGWGLARAGRDDLAQACFGEGQAWVSEAWPPGRAGAGWRTSARQCPACGALLDVALDQTAAVLAGRIGDERCPGCGGDGDGPFPQRVERQGVTPVVSGHTAIEAETGRAAEALLYQQQVCEPGSMFDADLYAPNWVADAVGSLDMLTIGGARSRGFGRVEVHIEAGTPPPAVAACADATRHALAARGAPLSEPVVLFDVVTAAHVPGGLAEALATRGAQLVTGDAVIELAGGWDERQDRARALHETVSRGSWLAVSGPLEALDALAGVVAADTEAWCPLWLRPREPAAGTPPADGKETAR